MNADPQLAGYYARRAPEYDRIYSRPERQSDLGWLQTELSRVAARRRVLEVACGTGWWTRILADAAASVTAMDINPEVLEVARGRLAVSRNGGTVSSPAPVQLLCRDLYSEEPLPGTYDCGFAGFWWSHVPRPSLPQFLTGFHRHLEPDAVVVFLDNRFVPGNSTPLSRSDTEGNTYQVRRLDDGSECEVLKNFPDPRELEATVAPVGRDVRITTRDYYWLMTYRVGPEGGHRS